MVRMIGADIETGDLTGGPEQADASGNAAMEAARVPGCATTVAAFAIGFGFASLAAGLGFLLTHSRVAVFLFVEAGLLGGVLAYLKLSGYRLSEALRLRPVPSAAYPLALQLGFALLLANFAATVLLEPSVRDIELVASPTGVWERAALAVTVALAAPVGEEMLFRGLLQRALESRLRPWLAIATAALPFALLHGPEPALFFFFWSLPVGWVAWRTRSIFPGVVVHAVNNLVGLAGLLFTGPIDPASIEPDRTLVATALVILPVAGLWALRLCLRIGRLIGAEADGAGEPLAPERR